MIYFWVTNIICVVTLMQGMIYFIQNFSKNDSLLKMTNLAPCMGFVAVGFNQDLYGGLSESRQICKNN